MTLLGVLPHLDDIPGDVFAGEFLKTRMVGINCDQSSPAGLRNNFATGWVQGLAKKIMAKGRLVLWSIPFPGPGQLEAIVRGAHTPLYAFIAREILATHPDDGSRIYVRLPWEFQLAANPENAMYDANGKPDPVLGGNAWRVIATIFRTISPRFALIWSPSIERNQLFDPKLAWPGSENVNFIWPDFYMGYTFGHQPGQYASWFKPAFMAMRDFAVEKGKRFGLAETGTDHDDFAADFEQWTADALACPNGCEVIVMWQNPDVIDCRVTGGRLPGIHAKVEALKL